MMINSAYLLSLWGVSAIIFILLVQWAVATIAKGIQKDAIPGKIDPNLGHESFIFRSYRTFMNTLENIPAMLGTCFLAIFLGTSPYWTAVFIWVFVICRVIHMVLYYVLATEKNPSPRSYFFVFGLLANICLFVLCVCQLALAQ